MTTPFERWVEEQVRLFQPKEVYWCDGSEDEARRLIDKGMGEEKIGDNPIFRELNHRTWPKSYLHRSHPTDVARTEHLTFVCHPQKEDSGPNNNWINPDEAKALLAKLSKGAMRGRTMYVLPYMMGHPDSPYARPCLQITDITDVAVSMRIMTRLGRQTIQKKGIFFSAALATGAVSPRLSHPTIVGKHKS